MGGEEKRLTKMCSFCAWCVKYSELERSTWIVDAVGLVGFAIAAAYAIGDYAQHVEVSIVVVGPMHLLTKSFEEKGIVEKVVDDEPRHPRSTAATTLLKHQNVKWTLRIPSLSKTHSFTTLSWCTYVLVNIEKGSMFRSWDLGQCIRAIFDNRKSPPTSLWGKTRTQSVVAHCVFQ